LAPGRQQPEREQASARPLVLAGREVRVPESVRAQALEQELRRLRRLRRLRAAGLLPRVSLVRLSVVRLSVVRLSVEAEPARPPVLVRRGGKRGSGR
jgi:hypothetical protein